MRVLGIATGLLCTLVMAATPLRTPQKTKDASADKSVSISNFQFTPGTVTVKSGDTVTWINKEGAHTVTADDGSWMSGNLSSGKSFSRKFDSPGKYPYHCEYHSSEGGRMAGVVEVVK
jgi:plastocyanin